MNKTVSINISGYVFYIEEDAFQVLKQYLEEIKQYFQNQEGGEEIVEDIEARVAEIFQPKATGNKEAITQADVDEVMASLGKPYQMVDDDLDDEKEQTATEESTQEEKKVYRNPDEKAVAGVCSGLAAYFGIDSLWVRLIFIILAFSSFGTGLLIYAILWIAIPEAKTTAQKLRMRGKAVNVNNIERAFREGANNLRDGVNDLINDRNKEGAKRGVRSASNGLEKIIGGLFQVTVAILKVLLKFIVIIALIVVVLAIVGMFISFFTSISLFGFIFHDLVSLVISSPLHSTLLLTSAFVVILLPLILIAIKGIQIITGKGRFSRTSLIIIGSVWLIFWVATIYEGGRIASEFKHEGSVEHEMSLVSPSQNRLYIRTNRGNDHEQYQANMDGNIVQFSSDEFYFIDGVFYYQNVELDVLPSQDVNFSLTNTVRSRGSSFQNAVENARQVQYSIEQTDSSLLLQPYVELKEGPFRAQEVELDLYIPLGAEVVFVNKTQGIDNRTQFDADYWWDYPNKVFRMTQQGLEFVSDEQPREVKNGYVNFEAINFNDIRIESESEVQISLREGNDYETRILSELSGKPGFRIFRRGDDLVVKIDDSWKDRLQQDKTHIYISSQLLDKIEFSGKGNLFVEKENGGDLQMNLVGSVNADMKIHLDKLDIEMAGVSNVRAAGTANYLKAEVSGKSELKGLDLVAENSKIELAGVCAVETNTTSKLEIEAAGLSQVKYKGSPNIEQELSGLAKVEKID